MRFDSNLAWTEAVARVRSNRDVLMALAGVFFMLPTLLSTVFLADIQEKMIALAQNSAALEALVRDNLGLILGFGIGGALVQFVGYLACTVILGVGGRPSVGEALSIALRALPTLLGATLLYMLGLLLASFVLGLPVGLGAALAGSAGASIGGLVMVVALVMLVVHTSVAFSLLIPVIVREGIASPVAALQRSWRLTRGHGPRLLGFYALLVVVYFLISFLISLLLVTPLTLVVGTGDAASFLAGVVAGLVGAVANVLLIAVLTRIHAQLCDALPEGQANIFE
ncbi:lipoyltransferase [Novosphingobium profundi]|uniref:lipoyltransferase n=1 Tax=Novosphingobium profundi TaxID=1774954 RepID=UPI001BDACEA6|nr:lipoyltransferase [Novosphingobium profundi]MBT0671192.1 lipoyltransferase [Novosphingobium profundi]